MQVPALLLLILLILLPPASSTEPGQPCPLEMNKVKDLLEVNCTEQGLSVVPPDLPEDTGILLLSANRLTSVSTATFLPLKQLQDLDLSDNGLVALHTGYLLPSLKELILSNNMLEVLPTLQGLPALTHLAVAHNSLVTLDPEAFQNVPLLKDLNLRGNKLQVLPQEAFAGLGALKDLDLSDNLLEELPKELLQDLHKLEIFWLSGNRLQTLPDGFFPEGHIFMYVFLTENPWHCDCNLQYLRTWIRQNEDSVYQPERGLEKTKVEVAPEKVVCHSPTTYQGKPIVHLKLNCGSLGDLDDEEEDEYGDGEETMEKTTTIPFLPPQPSTPKEHTTMPHDFTLPTTRCHLRTSCSSTLAPSTLFVMPTSTRAPTTTIPAPASSTIPPTQTPLTATVAALTSSPHGPTTFISTTSLSTTMSTRAPSTRSQPQTTLAPNTANTSVALRVSTGTSCTTAMAVLEASSIVRSSSPSLMTTTQPGVSTTMLFTHVSTPPAHLDTTYFTQPAPSPPPLPLCPCSTPGLAARVLQPQAGGKGPQWGHWVLRHCCQLHWGFYLASWALLVLTGLALAGWLVWMCAIARSSSHKYLKSPEVGYPLLKQELIEIPATYLSSFKSPHQRPMFCTIKEIELCPQFTYCTIKDLGTWRSPPATPSFRTTKELWIHQSPKNASFKSFSGKLMVPNLSSLKSPAYSLDRGVEAIGDVRVKYAGNTL